MFWLGNGASDQLIGRCEQLKSSNWQREFKHFPLAVLPVKDVICGSCREAAQQPAANRKSEAAGVTVSLGK